ncbi:unnamed protein product [Haemonchus placei]|uniref:Death domain-containing protein n=1 Tax=Haemonchus placei TaxID=6290 RepID=A0A0N4VXY6_HAEPC|nr:unnamed protein product [Haemonchus placei]
MAAENEVNQDTDAGVNSRQVSSEQEFGVESISEVLDKVVEEIRQGPVRIEKDLTEARVAGKYRTQLMRVWEIQAEQACSMLKETDVAHIRGVLKELPRNGQRRRVEPGNDEEKMETDENGPIEKTDTADWSALRASLETAFGTIGGSNRNVRSGPFECYGTNSSQCLCKSRSIQRELS